jgi:dolichyl-phosphate-mannose-protein mannosyltransferase
VGSVAQQPRAVDPLFLVHEASRQLHRREKLAKVLIVAAILNGIAQLCWFWPKAIHQIDIDAMDYTGIAVELKHGLFHSAINGFRSPLISWLIALIPGLSVFTSGKLITISTFLLSGVLLYVFTRRLWDSKLVAATAVLLFSFSRGLEFCAVALISPDFLFTALTLLYCVVLIECLRQDRHWLLLGGIHALAFLAKAFALPWLAVVTLTAVLIRPGNGSRVKRLALSAALPLIVATLWGAVLHSKYGVFTTGTQFKTNFLQSTLREYRNHRSPRYAVLADIAEYNDAYMVGDPTPPGTWPWHYKLQARRFVPAVIKAEITNVPRMIKELVIQANPGIVLAFVCMLLAVSVGSVRYGSVVQRSFLRIVTVAAAALILAYSMLVVDTRYLFPLAPLVIALGARFLWPEQGFGSTRLSQVCWLFVIGGIVWSLTYSSSPLRIQTRDFQQICYRAGTVLEQSGAKTVVSIGRGPFPEHGVGWEAGYKSAYFAHDRLIATAEAVPAAGDFGAILTDISSALPDAILVWNSDDTSRAQFIAALAAHQYPERAKIYDPVLGDVGVVLLRNHGSATTH